MDVMLAYDQPTGLTSAEGALLLELATNRKRADVRFHGRVRDPLRLRQVLLAFHACLTLDVRSQQGAWLDENEWRQTLDPVVTVQPDQIAFEAFSNDGSCYARLTMPLDAFEQVGELRPGTTSIDFTWNLRETLLNLRSSRATYLSIGSDGVQVAAAPVDGFVRQVSVPEKWVKGFLQVQGALTMRAFTFDVKPVDLLSVIAYLDEHYAKRPPHGIRFVFAPNAPIKLVLEPWEESFTLRGSYYTGYPRTVRLWGRKRLALLREVLPYTDRVTVAVLGRGMPHMYLCHCGPYQFLLALSGWTANDWAMGSAFDLLVAQQGDRPELASRVYAYLTEHLAARSLDIAANTGIGEADVTQALFQLCRGGRVMYDLVTGKYRLRELFATPLDVDALFAVDPRVADAQRLLDGGHVTLERTNLRGQAGRNETRATAIVADDAEYTVTIAVDESGRLRYGRCECAFFQANLMAKGPCAHILATRMAFDNAATEAATSVTAGAANDDDEEDEDEE